MLNIHVYFTPPRITQAGGPAVVWSPRWRKCYIGGVSDTRKFGPIGMPNPTSLRENQEARNRRPAYHRGIFSKNAPPLNANTFRYSELLDAQTARKKQIISTENRISGADMERLRRPGTQYGVMRSRWGGVIELHYAPPSLAHYAIRECPIRSRPLHISGMGRGGPGHFQGPDTQLIYHLHIAKRIWGAWYGSFQTLGCSLGVPYRAK